VRRPLSLFFHRKAALKVSDTPVSGEHAASAATTHTFFFLFGKEEEKYGAKKEGKRSRREPFFFEKVPRRRLFHTDSTPFVHSLRSVLTQSTGAEFF
jgi:hypothetical protein